MPDISNSALVEIIEANDDAKSRQKLATLILQKLTLEDLWLFFIDRTFHGWLNLNLFFRSTELHDLMLDHLIEIQRFKQAERKEDTPKRLLDDVIMLMLNDRNGMWLSMGVGNLNQQNAAKFLKLVSKEVFNEMFAHFEKYKFDHLEIAAKVFPCYFQNILAASKPILIRESAGEIRYLYPKDQVTESIPRFAYLARLLSEDDFISYWSSMVDERIGDRLYLPWTIKDRSTFDPEQREQRAIALQAIVQHHQSFKVIILLLIKFYLFYRDERFEIKTSVEKNQYLLPQQKLIFANLYSELKQIAEQDSFPSRYDFIFRSINSLIVKVDHTNVTYTDTLRYFLQNEFNDPSRQIQFLSAKLAINLYEQNNSHEEKDNNGMHLVNQMREGFLAVGDALPLGTEDHLLIGMHLTPWGSASANASVLNQGLHHLQQAQQNNQEARLLLQAYTWPNKKFLSNQYRNPDAYARHNARKVKHIGWMAFNAEFAEFKKLCDSDARKKFLRDLTPAKMAFEKATITGQMNAGNFLLDIISEHLKKFTKVPGEIFQRNLYLVTLKKMHSILENTRIYDKNQRAYFTMTRR